MKNSTNHSVPSTSRSAVLGLLVTVLVTGCAEFTVFRKPAPEATPETSSFGREWDASIGRMGVTPIVPPSEDIRVGDIFVYPYNPDFAVSGLHRSHLGGLAASPRWASLNLLEHLREEYRQRPAWPATPSDYLQIAEDPNNRPWAEAATPQDRDVFAEAGVTRRLRNVGIPEFSSVTLTDGDVNSLVPTEAINLVFGSAWQDNKVVTFRISSAETYSLAMRKIIDLALIDLGQGEFALNSPYRDHLTLMADPDSDAVWVRILSDVIYIRSIDIIVQSESGFEDDEEAVANEFVEEDDPTEVVVLVQSAPAETGETNGATAVEAGDAAGEVASQIVAEVEDAQIENLAHVLDPAYAAFVRADAINEILMKSDSDDLPGGFMRFISVTDDSAIVRRFWQRGLAIGVRGMTLELDKVTGEVLRSSPLGTLPIPAPPAEAEPVE